MGFSICQYVTCKSHGLFPKDSIELLGVMVVTAARRLSSAGQVLVDYIVTVAVGAATWSQGSGKIWKIWKVVEP